MSTLNVLTILVCMATLTICIAECTVSILFLLSIFLIRKDAARQSNSEARHRVTEATLCSDAGLVEKELETDLRLSELSKTLNRAPSASTAKV